jgi:PadR family transcriptional regulator, regulatory protein PadR
MQMNIKGSLPLLILNVLANGESHGYHIAKQIKQQSSGVLDFKEGTLYPTLHNLEEQGAIQSFEAAENGRTRRYYRLTEDGAALLQQEQAEWARYTAAVNTVLKGGAHS